MGVWLIFHANMLSWVVEQIVACKVAT